jgi:hypothetical protein
VKLRDGRDFFLGLWGTGAPKDVADREARQIMARRSIAPGVCWLRLGCVAWPRSATFCKAATRIVQSLEGFDLRERTLNLRVVGSIPTRLTIDSKGLNDIDHSINGDQNLLVVGSTFHPAHRSRSFNSSLDFPIPA